VIEFRETCKRAACVAIFLALVAVFLGATPVFAQSEGSALGTSLPLGGLERYVGPLIPANGLVSSFRSELLGGISGGQLVAAKLTGSLSGETNLEKAALLDTGPLRYDAEAVFRFWRLAARIKYSNFQEDTRTPNFGQIDFTGLSLAGNFDAVQFPWLTLGASAKFYLYQPSFQGLARYVTTTTPGATADVNLTVKGQDPITAGGYLRYVPPEILGLPMHVEAWFQIPVSGSQLKNYGGALVFRPQIYRFDVALKALVEKEYLKFKATPSAQLPVSGTLPAQDWEVDMEWDFLGAELAVYF
jgi:hypothetical protein